MTGEHHISVSRTLRYYTRGEITAANPLLTVLHGYAQHPGFFIRKVEDLLSEGWGILAPEGLHRFYVNGSSGRVGASWMTKEDRLHDIADHIAYLNQLHLTEPMAFANRRVLLGFSQGAATAVRYFCATNIRFERLVLWAGSFPPDVALPEFGERLKSAQIDLVIGAHDNIVPAEVYDQLHSNLEAAGAAVRLHRFEGEHDLHLPTLRKVLEIVD